MQNIIAFICGCIFALGLLISGMTNPAKVLAFLDITGQWNPSLLWVMGGAITIAIFPFQYAVRHKNLKTLFQQPIELPQATIINSKLLLGAIIFGIGWGLSGICPAPALTLLGLGYIEVLYFIIPMFIGMWLYNKTIA
ncbi:MAG: YeeE/YedE thiosulfate transporter family protein [Acinetobacter sp.]